MESIIIAKYLDESGRNYILSKTIEGYYTLKIGDLLDGNEKLYFMSKCIVDCTDMLRADGAYEVDDNGVSMPRGYLTSF